MGVAFQAVFLTLLLLLGIGFLVWTFLLKPVISRAEEVVETADETFDKRIVEESISEQERKLAVEELELNLGEPEDRENQ